MPLKNLLVESLRLLGFQLGDKKPEQDYKSFAIPPNLDGSSQTSMGGVYGTYVDLEGQAKNESELITRYRDMAMQPECEQALEDIITDAIVQEDNKSTVQINLQQLDQPDEVKKEVTEAFHYILQLLNFHEDGMEIFKRWYVDGRLFYHILIDQERPKEGIKELRNLDPRRIRKIKEIKKKMGGGGVEIIDAILEYYLYNERGIVSIDANAATGIRIAPDSICYVHSGQIDTLRHMVVSYLHKAIKPLNQLRAMEDAHVIYRLSRAAERRIFYIDVGNMPTQRAEQYVKAIMNDYRNKLVYDACLSMDTKVPLLDGRNLTLTEISEEFKQGSRLWTYSTNPETGAIAPGLITSAGVTRKNQEVVRITLDNDKSVVCTLDHSFPIWNKGKVQAKDLQVGDSVIPFYRRDKTIHGGSKHSLYEQLFDNEQKKWLFTHRLVSKWKDQNEILNETVFNEKYINSEKNTIHHVNYDRRNNAPENLLRMNVLDHFEYHKQHCSLAGKIGGKVTANRKRLAGVADYFNLTPERRIEIGKISGKIGGKKCVSNGTGIHGLSNNEICKNSKLGVETFQKKLITDKNFRESFCKSVSLGLEKIDWSKRMQEFGKNLPHSHMVKMNLKANKIRWADPDQKLQHSNRQRIIYSQKMLDLLVHCARETKSISEILKAFNSNKELISEWSELNKNQKLRGKGKKEFNSLHENDIRKMTSSLGFSCLRKFHDSIVFKNHKIIKIEYLPEKIDVGTLSIDRNEIYHKFHTFALDCGIFTFNSTGAVRDDKKFLSMQEDFFLPRREGGRGTEVTTLPGGQNLNSIEDIKYFQERLYKALHVPTSRLSTDNGFGMGRSAEISRDEVKFSRFITKLRKRFDHLFKELLKIQLVLKGSILLEEWETIFRENIFFDYQKDSVFSEAKGQEIWTSRITLLQQFDPGQIVDRYVSRYWLKKNILQFSDIEIEELQKQIEEEGPIAQEEAERAAALETGALFDPELETNFGDSNPVAPLNKKKAPAKKPEKKPKVPESVPKKKSSEQSGKKKPSGVKKNE